MDKKLQSISAKRVVELSILDELGTKQNERVHGQPTPRTHLPYPGAICPNRPA
jgi:hypothetical protein